MSCAICRTRKPRRFCPGMHGDICTLCCGTEREVTVDCPFDCPFLQEARKHEHTGPVKPDELPNKDIRITEDFLEEHEPLLVGAMSSLALAVFDTPGAVDSDVRDALDALIRTERTLQSGVYYETRPANALANHIFSETHKGLAEFRKRESEKLGMTHTRDADVLGVLVFLQRLELDRNNGRPRGRAFLDSLRGFLGDVQGAIPQGPPQYSPLILP